MSVKKCIKSQEFVTVIFILFFFSLIGFIILVSLKYNNKINRSKCQFSKECNANMSCVDFHCVYVNATLNDIGRINFFFNT